MLTWEERRAHEGMYSYYRTVILHAIAVMMFFIDIMKLGRVGLLIKAVLITPGVVV